MTRTQSASIASSGQQVLCSPLHRTVVSETLKRGWDLVHLCVSVTWTEWQGYYCTTKNVNGKEPLETTTPLLTQSTVWQDMSRPLYSGCEQDTVACEHTYSELASLTPHSVIAKKWNRQPTTSSRTFPVMAAGWVNHQQAVGNGWRPAALHHPIPGNKWTEGLSMADRPQKRKKKNCTIHLWCEELRQDLDKFKHCSFIPPTKWEFIILGYAAKYWDAEARLGPYQ